MIYSGNNWSSQNSPGSASLLPPQQEAFKSFNTHSHSFFFLPVFKSSQNLLPRHTAVSRPQEDFSARPQEEKTSQNFPFWVHLRHAILTHRLFCAFVLTLRSEEEENVHQLTLLHFPTCFSSEGTFFQMLKDDKVTKLSFQVREVLKSLDATLRKPKSQFAQSTTQGCDSRRNEQGFSKKRDNGALLQL